MGKSQNLDEPVERVSDSKISNRQVKMLLQDIPNNAKRILEKLYPGYYLISASDPKTSNWFEDGVYFEFTMRSVDPKKRLFRKKGNNRKSPKKRADNGKNNKRQALSKPPVTSSKPAEQRNPCFGLLSWAREKGLPDTYRFFNTLMERTTPRNGWLYGIFNMVEKYGIGALECTCQAAIAAGEYSYRYIKTHIVEGRDQNATTILKELKRSSQVRYEQITIFDLLNNNKQ